MRLLILTCLALAAGACVGQSGSEIERPGDEPDPGPMSPVPIDPGIPHMPPPSHCPCGQLRQMQQIRATILAVEDFPEVGVQRYRLSADEIVSDAPDGGSELQAGDEFGGYWSGDLACATAMRAPLPVGEDVIAFFRPGLQDSVLCCDYVACSDDCRALASDGDDGSEAQQECESACADQTASACAQHHDETLLHGDLMLIPWGDALVVGESESATVSITPDDLGALTLDLDACEAAIDDLYPALYPPEPSQEPNDDTNGEGEGDFEEGKELPPASQPASMPESPPPPGATPTPPDAGAAAPTDSTPPPPANAPASGETPGGSSPGTNPTGQPDAPPPAHPEEIRVRCAMP